MQKIGISKEVVRNKMKAEGIEHYVDLAKRAGVSDKTLYNTLNDRKFKLATLETLAHALRTDPRELLEVKDG